MMGITCNHIYDGERDPGIGNTTNAEAARRAG